METTAFQILDERGQLGFFKVLSGLQYLSIPLVYLWKFTVISFVLWLGGFTYGYKLTYKRSWQIVMFAELVFVAAEVIKVLWFMVVSTEADFLEIKAFYPLSLMNFFNHLELESKYHYVLKSLNLFEVAYWFILVYGVHWSMKKKLSTAYAIVFSSYVLFFLLWLWFTLGVSG